MSQPLYIPKLGLTREEATIVAWLCERGARVVKGQPYLTIETDKITYDVAAEEDGYLEPVAPVQAVLEVGDLVGYLHATADAARTGAGAPEGAAATAVASPTEPGTAARPPPTPTRAAGGAAIPAATTTAGGRRLISPLARRIAEEHRLRYDDLPGTAQRVQTYVDAGATHLILNLRYPYPAGIVAQLAEEVVPRVKPR